MSEIIAFFSMAYERLSRNLIRSLDGMSPEKWIRVVIVVGTYMLLRPYLLKLGGKAQMRQHESEAAAAAEEAEAKAKAKMSPNELRGHKIQIPEDSDNSEDEGEAQASSADWGKKARRRQRTMVKKILEAEEQRLRELQEDEEDKDIEEFLMA